MSKQYLATRSQPSDTTQETNQRAATGCFVRKLFGSLLMLLGGMLGAVVDGHAQLPTTCTTPAPDPCLYISDLDYSVGRMDFGLQHPARRSYRLPLRVHFPANAVDARPVVIWNHGGEPSIDGRTRSARWGETLAAAGYVVIHPSRKPVPNAQRFLRQCADNGFTTLMECERWIAQSRVGPKNTHFLIDNLATIGNTIGITLDAAKIVVAGHSAGTITVLANAGAWQQWVPGGRIYSERDDRPIAFLATAPQGPMYANYLLPGFQSGDSFERIERPFAFITGVGDRTGEPPEARITAWLTSTPDDNKFLSYDTHPQARHETMNINVCDGPVRTHHCVWIASFGLAFLDATVRNRQEAVDWLESDAYQVLTGGTIELHRR